MLGCLTCSVVSCYACYLIGCGKIDKKKEGYGKGGRWKGMGREEGEKEERKKEKIRRHSGPTLQFIWVGTLSSFFHPHLTSLNITPFFLSLLGFNTIPLCVINIPKLCRLKPIDFNCLSSSHSFDVL